MSTHIRMTMNRRMTTHLQVPYLQLDELSTKRSPQIKVFHEGHPIRITLDSGAEISMIKTSVAKYLGAVIKATKQSALQADGITPLPTVGETHL